MIILVTSILTAYNKKTLFPTCASIVRTYEKQRLFPQTGSPQIRPVSFIWQSPTAVPPAYPQFGRSNRSKANIG